METEILAVVVTVAITVATSIPIGRYMARVFGGGTTWLDPVFVPIERLVLRLSHVDPDEQQDWKSYSVSLLVSNVFMWLATFAIVTLQGVLFLNPDGIGAMEPTLAFNTISSFVRTPIYSITAKPACRTCRK
jgi:K+-transporting ATPase ATPase A chain